MALFVAPRALYAILEDILPMNILTNDNIAVTVERLAFSLSAGVVVTASVHEEKHIRGIVRYGLPFPHSSPEADLTCYPSVRV